MTIPLPLRQHILLLSTNLLLEILTRSGIKTLRRLLADIADIPKLKELNFPRYIKGEIDFVDIFGDASKTGIGVLAYAVLKDHSGIVHSQIIYSKSTPMIILRSHRRSGGRWKTSVWW